MQSLREEYESTIRELREKVIEYKNRLKLEEQKNAQSNDFGFEDDDTTRVQLENEALQKRIKVIEAEKLEANQLAKTSKDEGHKNQRGLELAQKENSDLKRQMDELRNLYTRLEVANENLKQSGGNERVASSSVKQFSELEKRYIQTKR